MLLVLLLLYNISTVCAIEGASENHELTPTELGAVLFDLNDGEHAEDRIEATWQLVSNFVSQKLFQEAEQVLENRFAEYASFRREKVLPVLYYSYDSSYEAYKRNYLILDHNFSTQDFMYQYLLDYFYNNTDVFFEET